MPELPEVETTARGMRSRLVGLRLMRVGGVDWPRMLPNSSGPELDAELRGRRLEDVERRGKYLLLRFEHGVILGLHRKMSGNLLVRAADEPLELHTHLVLSFEHDTELRFVDPRKFGRVYLFHEQGALDVFVGERLGPEPLEGLTADRLAGLLRGRRGRIKSLLLDQRFLAGIGNIYADEALWQAGIHPLRAADMLSRAEIARLASSIRLVLGKAIERRGTSFSSYRDAEGLEGENQAFLQAYGRGRTGQPCLRCGSAFQTLTLGQRTSHYCPRCQPAARRRRAVSRTSPRT